MKHLDLELTNRLASLFHCTTDLSQEVDWRWLCFGEDIYVVRRHPLLSNKNLLRTIYDEVSTRVVWTFIKVVQVLILKVPEDTKSRAEHDWDLL